MALSIYQKHRPKKFRQISGQKYIVKILSNSIINDRISNAYLLTGSHGTGKTTLARIFAKTLNCLDPEKGDKEIKIESCGKCNNCKLISSNQTIDLMEIDAASHTGVDNIRQLKENVFTPPSALKYKIYIIDEVHMLSLGAFNALLKILEEPPAHAIFILATTEIHKVPETIISRCQKFDFQKLSQTEIIDRLKQISKKEKITIEDQALENIALESEGGMRDAESLLGQIIAYKDKDISANDVNQIIGLSSRKTALDFVENLLSRKIKKSLDIIEKLQNEGINLKNFNKLILFFLRDVLLQKANPDQSTDNVTLSPQQSTIVKKLAKENTCQQLLLASKLFQKNIGLFRETSIAQLPLELAVIEYHLNTPGDTYISQPTTNQQTNQPAQVKDTTPKYIPSPESKTPGTNKPLPAKEETSKKEGSLIKNEPKRAEPSKSNNKNNATITIKKVCDKWSEVLEGVKSHNHSIQAFLKNCVPIGVENNKLYIKAKYDFYKEKLNEYNNRLTIKKVVDKILQCDLQIVFCSEQEAQKKKFGNQDKSANNDPLYDAMQMMGGRIVE